MWSYILTKVNTTTTKPKPSEDIELISIEKNVNKDLKE